MGVSEKTFFFNIYIKKCVHNHLIPQSVVHIIKAESLWTLWHEGIQCSSFMNEAHMTEQVPLPGVKKVVCF